jgi:hypothetical protein
MAWRCARFDGRPQRRAAARLPQLALPVFIGFFGFGVALNFGEFQNRQNQAYHQHRENHDGRQQ